MCVRICVCVHNCTPVQPPDCGPFNTLLGRVANCITCDRNHTGLGFFSGGVASQQEGIPHVYAFHALG